MTQRELDRYFRKLCAGGRSTFARAFDAVALRLLLGAGAFLAARAYLPLWAAAALASVIVALISMLLGVVSVWRLARFTVRETRRIRRVLMTDTLALLSVSEAIQLTAPLCGEGETPLPILSVSKATAEQLVAALKKHPPDEKLAVFSAAGYDEAARALARRFPARLRLHEVRTLLDAAEQTTLYPGDAEVHAFIRAELAAGKRRRAAARAETFAPGGAKRYFLLGAIMTLLSFVTRYPLYCRMLAGLSLALGAISAGMRRMHQNASE